MRRVVATIACLLPVVPVYAQAAGAPRSRPVAPRHEIVTLLGTHAVRDVPRIGARAIAYVGARRPLTGARTVLPVLAQTIDERGRSWQRVRLPGRTLAKKPPPRVGWITTSKTRRRATAWHIVVDVSARQVAVYRDGRRLRSFRSIVGKPSTPTPLGEYFVEENVRLPAGHSAAPVALALSARSAVLQEFDGGPGQIALHGRRNIGGKLGTAVSHGCVRLADRAVSWLAARIRPGVPVSIEQ